MPALQGRDFIHPDDPSPWAFMFAVHSPLLGRDNYCAGTDGGIWSRKKSNRYAGMEGIWRPLSQAYNAFGYLVICFRRGETIFAHRLILEAFVGACPGGMECRHLNGRRDDNRLDNLKWGTPAENGADRVRHGTAVGRVMPGESHPRARLSRDDVREIRRLRGLGVPRLILAERYGVTKNYIGCITKGTAWACEPL